MRAALREVARALLMCVALPQAGRAAFCTATPPVSEPRHDFEFFAGYSPGTATLIGTTTDRRFVLAGFSYSYRCWAWRHASISYTGAVMPAAIVLQPAHAVYAFGIVPLGFTFEFRPGHRIHPFAEWMGGLIASTEPIPENQPDATGLNFLFDIGGGVRWEFGGRGHAVSAGYKFLHISNAGTTDYNPGLDNNVIYIGYSFLR